MSNSSLFNEILYLKKKPSTVIKKISYIINYSFHSSFKHTIKNQFPEVLNAAFLKKTLQKEIPLIIPKKAFLQYQNYS